VGNGAAEQTTDGGAQWTADVLPSSGLVLTGIDCTGTSDCIAVGTRTNGGGVILTL
jgi:photosystem II stability/assembly factor-like uncharacterized protein